MFVLLDHKWNVKASQCVCFTSSHVEVSQCVSCWMFVLLDHKWNVKASQCVCFTSSLARCWSVPVCVMLNVSPLHRQGVEVSQCVSCWIHLFTGKVLKCPNVRRATVMFTDGEREVLTRFILPVSGAVACPPLSVSVELICPVPHLLCPVPPSRTPHQTPTFSVLHPHPTPTSSVLYPHHTPHIWLPSSLSYTPITPTTSHPPPPLSYTPLSVSVELISPVPLLCSIPPSHPPTPLSYTPITPTLPPSWAVASNSLSPPPPPKPCS